MLDGSYISQIATTLVSNARPTTSLLEARPVSHIGQDYPVYRIKCQAFEMPKQAGLKAAFWGLVPRAVAHLHKHYLEIVASCIECQGEA
jgi:hypothetical protein